MAKALKATLLLLALALFAAIPAVASAQTENSGVTSRITAQQGPPSVSISAGANVQVRLNSPVPVTATFSEPVSGFTLDDISVGQRRGQRLLRQRRRLGLHLRGDARLPGRGDGGHCRRGGDGRRGRRQHRGSAVVAWAFPTTSTGTEASARMRPSRPWSITSPAVSPRPRP